MSSIDAQMRDESASSNASLCSASRRQARSSPSLFCSEAEPVSQKQSQHSSSSHYSHPASSTWIVSSKAETLLLSSAGDVLVSRCRNSPYPQQSEQNGGWGSNGDYSWQQDIVATCCDAECDDLSTSVQDAAVCMNAPWNTNAQHSRKSKSPSKKSNSGVSPRSSTHPGSMRTGLLGGAPAEVASPLHDDGLRGGGGGGVYYDDYQAENDGIYANQRMQHAHFQTQQRSTQTSYNGMDDAEYGNEAGIVAIRSFDYSHFTEGGNDMIPERAPVAFALESRARSDTTPKAKKTSPRNRSTESAPTEPFIHGVPTFLPDFSLVRITQVSAHPLGSHVLLISDAGLLYSYGLNDYGQLGIGMRTPPVGLNKGYIMTPTIVTPLVENGGKTIACAAGVNHSLVVVMTEEQRIVKSRSFEHSSSPTGDQQQLSRGNSNASTELIMYHQMYGFGRNDSMKIGLISVKANYDGSESVLLPRRVALRCKVKTDGSPTKLPQGIFNIAASADHSAALVRKASGDVEVYTWGNASYGSLGLPHPIAGLDGLNGGMHTVPVPSFVASISSTSNTVARSSSLLLEDEGEYPMGISLGRRCSFVVTSIGRCFSFGMSEEGMLGLGEGITEVGNPTELSFPGTLADDSIASVSAGAHHVVALTKNGNAFAWGHKSHVGLATSPQEGEPSGVAWCPERIEFRDQQGPAGSSRIIQACAGYDNSLFVAESGRVLSCGKNSGRLGLGELSSNVDVPRPLYAGLCLWKQRKQEPPVIRRKKAPPTLLRGMTTLT